MFQIRIDAVFKLTSEIRRLNRLIKCSREHNKKPLPKPSISFMKNQASLDALKAWREGIRAVLRREIERRVSTPLYRDVLIMKFVEEQTVADMTVALNYSEASVCAFTKKGLAEWAANSHD